MVFSIVKSGLAGPVNHLEKKHPIVGSVEALAAATEAQ